MADDRPVYDRPQALSEAAIRAQMQAGSDMNIPVEVRPPTSPRPQGIVLAEASRPTRMGKLSSAADSADQNYDQEGGRLAKPANAAVISRATAVLSPIPVQRLDGERPIGSNMLEESQPIQPTTGAVADLASMPDIPVRPAADASVGVASPDVVIGGGERATGFTPLVRQETRLSTLAPIHETTQPPAVKVAQVQHPIQPEQPPAPAPAPAQPAAPQVVHVQVPVERPKKQAVKLSSETLGNHRIKVDFVGVSDNTVVLAYIDDDDAQIFEPPKTPSDSPLQVTIGDKTYRCAYYGLSVEMTFGPFRVFQVVFVRVDN